MNYISLIPDYCRKVMQVITSSGYEVYVVGGAVRDIIMGKEPGDYDLATSATPEELIAVFSNNNIKYISSYASHGTVLAVVEGRSLEITAFRIDGEYSDVRRPDEVLFTRSIKEDVARRDFTMNSLYLDEKGEVKDVFGGIQDIQSRVIRAVGNPDKRFSEDALRILRTLRFSSVLGFEIDKATSEGMRHNAVLLSRISGERKQVEMNGILTGEYAVNTIRENIDILSVIIPELQQLKGFDQKSQYHDSDCLEHTLRVLGRIPLDSKNKRNVVLAYAALLHDIAKPQVFVLDAKGSGHMKGHPEAGARIASRVADELKFSAEMKSTVCELVRKHDSFSTNRAAVWKDMATYSSSFLNMLEQLQEADINAHSPLGRKRISKLQIEQDIREELTSQHVCLSIKQLDIDGNELIKLGILPGPKIGQALEFLFEKVIAEEVPNQKQDLINLLACNGFLV